MRRRRSCSEQRRQLESSSMTYRFRLLLDNADSREQPCLYQFLGPAREKVREKEREKERESLPCTGASLCLLDGHSLLE